MTSAPEQNSGCLTFFLNLFGGKKQPAAAPVGPLPYRLRDDFLSPAELSFYHVLASVIDTRGVISAKVRLADIFFVARPNENKGAYNAINQKHVDFLICDPLTMKPLFAAELDDASHNRADRKERDEFVDKTFQAASLPLLHIAAQRDYNPRDIAAQIAPYIAAKVEPTPAPAAPASPSPAPALPINNAASAAPVCPKCGVPLVVRTVAQGEHKGKQFYGCVNYPRCREMKPLPAAKITSP
jgi:hypothetical protein